MKNEIRRMSDMDEFFESRGIKVDRKYDGRAKVYQFRLTVDNLMKVFNFTYPAELNNHEKYQEMTKACYDMLHDFGQFCKEHGVNLVEATRSTWTNSGSLKCSFDIKNVIFNDPATIVFWSDGTKTVVKCSENDIYDPEKGLAMAFSKKMFGNDNTFHKHFKKWLPEEEAEVVNIYVDDNVIQRAEAVKKLGDAIVAGFQAALKGSGKDVKRCLTK